MDTKTLRQKILDLAIRGKLVPQDPNDEPASVLLERIRAEKQQMVREGKLKAKDIKGDTVIFAPENSVYMMGDTALYWKTIRDMEMLFEFFRYVDIAGYTNVFGAFTVQNHEP